MTFQPRPSPPLVSPVDYLRSMGWRIERLPYTLDDFDMTAPAGSREHSMSMVGKPQILRTAARLGWTMRSA